MNVRRVSEISGNAHDVKAAGRPAVSEVVLKIVTGRSNQLALLAGCHGFERATPVAVSPVAYFHEDQGLPVLHDEVYFARLALKVALNQAQSGISQVLACQRFGLIATDFFQGEWFFQCACHSAPE